MNLTNRDKVERILNIVRDSLRSFVKPLIDDALKSKSLKHSDFQKVVNKRIGLKGYEVHKWDATALFTFILDKDLRSIVFDGVFSDNQIEELYELRKMRNDWAHQESFSDDDLSLLLDLAHQLLIIIKAYEDAEKLKEITIEHEALEPVENEDEEIHQDEIEEITIEHEAPEPVENEDGEIHQDEIEEITIEHEAPEPVENKDGEIHQDKIEEITIEDEVPEPVENKDEEIHRDKIEEITTERKVPPRHSKKSRDYTNRRNAIFLILGMTVMVVVIGILVVNVETPPTDQCIEYRNGQRNQNSEEGLNTCLLAAKDSSNVIAQYLLGEIYSDSLLAGRDANIDTALEWYHKSAKGNYPPAQYKLGRYLMDLYDQNRCNECLSYAESWFRPSAASGYPPSQYELGDIYLNGKGTDQDIDQAQRWYRSASEQRKIPDQRDLIPHIYEFCWVGGRNFENAKRCYVTAREQGYPPALYLLGEISIRVNQDTLEAREYYQKASDQGYPYAQKSLANFVLRGWGGDQDFDKARELFQIVATLGHGDAQSSLAAMYFFGIGVSKNYQEAFEWFEKSAESGDVWGRYGLGLMYVKGQATTRDCDMAVELFRDATNRGLKEAQFQLGEMYANGCGVPLDSVIARRWFRNSALQGYAPAQKSLADMYRRGQGMRQKNLEEARRLYFLASEQNYSSAQSSLGEMHLFGEGVLKSNKEAKAWFLSASVPKETPEDISWWEQMQILSGQSSIDGDDWGRTWLAWVITDGLRDFDEVERADSLLQLVTDPGNILAVKLRHLISAVDQWTSQDVIRTQFELGELFRIGQIIPQDTEEAGRWIRLSADQGYSDAQYELALMLLNETDAPKEAFEYLKSAANQNHPDANYKLYELYVTGLPSVKKDDEEALIWLKQASENCHVQAQYQLGLLYSSDNKVRGVPKNDIWAYAWINLSSNLGYKDAIDVKKRLYADLTFGQREAADKFTTEQLPSCN